MMRQRGYTLTELMVVVAILGIVAIVAVPSLFSGNSQKLDVAASELAEAIRFSRSEALRTGTANGVIYAPSPLRFSLYREVYTANVPISTFDVRHPVDKKLYTLEYSSTGNQTPVTISSVIFKYGGSAVNRDYISFDEHGIPRYLNGSTYQMLDDATIVLEYMSHTRTVRVAPMTGRVTVQ